MILESLNYEFPDRRIVDSKEWRNLLEKSELDFYGCPENGDYEFDNDSFTIRRFYWGDDEFEKTKPNFLYKPTGFAISWYKYPFRSSDMNQDLTKKEILNIFKKCLESL